MSDYFVITHPTKGFLKRSKGFNRHILHPTTIYTADMIVILGIAIEPLLGASKLQFLYHAAFGQNPKITVNSAQADPRQSLAYHLVNLVGSRMGGDLFQLFDDNSSLVSHPELSVYGQVSLLFNNNNYY